MSSLKGEKGAEEVSKTLNFKLPFGHMPLPLKIIALLTSVGGLSIVASLFTDIVQPHNGVAYYFYPVRLITGVVMIVVGYGIVKKKGWALWLYAGITMVGLVVNPVLAIIPALITAYLYTHKNYFNKVSLKEVWSIFKRQNKN